VIILALLSLGLIKAALEVVATGFGKWSPSKKFKFHLLERRSKAVGGVRVPSEM
jgi:hypothetical protein